MKKGISEQGWQKLARAMSSEVVKEATVNNEVWDKVDHLREILGDDEFIMAWIKASSDEEALANADFIIQTYDIPMGIEEE